MTEECLFFYCHSWKYGFVDKCAACCGLCVVRGRMCQRAIHQTSFTACPVSIGYWWTEARKNEIGEIKLNFFRMRWSVANWIINKIALIFEWDRDKSVIGIAYWHASLIANDTACAAIRSPIIIISTTEQKTMKAYYSLIFFRHPSERHLTIELEMRDRDRDRERESEKGDICTATTSYRKINKKQMSLAIKTCHIFTVNKISTIFRAQAAAKRL